MIDPKNVIIKFITTDVRVGTATLKEIYDGVGWEYGLEDNILDCTREGTEILDISIS